LDAVLVIEDSEEPDPPPIEVIVVKAAPEIVEFPPLKFAGSWDVALEPDETPPAPTLIE
jgi:hypothetical protein